MTFAAGWAALVVIGSMDLASAQSNLPSGATPQASQGPSTQGLGSAGAGEQGRVQAPIGHRQPRPQDVSPGVSRDEGNEFEAERELDKKLEICRGC
jgi:hypothetical protein